MEMLKRPRRLRGSEVLRKMVRETRMDKSISDLSDVCKRRKRNYRGDSYDAGSVPLQCRHSAERSLWRSLQDAGVESVMFFGIPDHKDECRKRRLRSENGIVQKALPAGKKQISRRCICITDVCMCEYTSHGHCGVLCGHDVDNDRTLELLAKTALSHVEAGADMVAPSDMMDGRVPRHP